ncbi:phage tail assembly protein T [Sodalis ligni]|uniref:Minor tail T domain-containing protein n=1 Tax=Sodalis ligni TaxID=2697027 RepID=A0A4R1NHB7_9GAMM|nr:phage tail protein [Sodalis ligni]TCL06913.1 hypothetical protein EZJ58_5211 [Sodalis ligni]
MNGIGGRTIAEAQERMSLPEFRIWLKYRQKYGNLNPMMRTEWAAALISSVLANVNRGKDSLPFKLTDFAPHIEDSATITLEEAMQEWR